VRTFLVAAALSVAVLLVRATSASAVAPTSASCIGQFFSSHAGLGAAHTGVTVRSFTSVTAKELRREFGRRSAGARVLPRDACGL
jgi:hypothetical protein